VITTSVTGSSVIVLLNNGDGTFQDGVYYTAGTWPTGVTIGDLNLDGKVDLVATLYHANSFSVLIGNGDGTLQAARISRTSGSSGYEHTVIADFNGDGKLDLVGQEDGYIAVIRGNGDGTFQQAPDSIGDMEQFFNLAVGDVNNDGRLDVFGIGEGLDVIRGNGDGTFQGPNQLPLYTDPNYWGVVGDFNGDRNQDIAVIRYLSGDGLLFAGNGDGTFQAPITLDTGTGPYALAAADLDGDGILDLAVGHNCGGVCGYIRVLRGNGGGAFQNAGDYTVAANAGPVAIGDFNGDHKPDIVVASPQTLSVLLNNGDGTFQPTLTAHYGSVLDPNSLAVGDLNGDGNPDVAIGGHSDGSVIVFLGNGDGTFASAVTVPASSGQETSVALGDVNGDGKLDLIAGYRGITYSTQPCCIAVLLNNTIPPNTPAGVNVDTQPVDNTTHTAPLVLTFSDVQQAGNTVLTTGSSGTAPPSGFQLGSPATYYNLSTTATFSGPVSVCINYAGTSYNDQTNLRLFHFANGSWTDITASLDTAHTTICGSTTSFSPFAIAQPIYSAQVQQPINADRSSVFSTKKGVVPVKFSLTAANVPTCSLPAATIALTRTSGSSPGVIDENVYEMSSDNGSYFRISSCQYVYNLSAQSLGAGTYRADILIGSQIVGSGTFGLK
jgi:FG-GAP-like repeat/FG-GAP repeat